MRLIRRLCLRVCQDGGVEAAVDVREQRVRVVATAPPVKQSREAHGRPQFPRPGSLRPPSIFSVADVSRPLESKDRLSSLPTAPRMVQARRRTCRKSLIPLDSRHHIWHGVWQAHFRIACRNCCLTDYSSRILSSASVTWTNMRFPPYLTQRRQGTRCCAQRLLQYFHSPRAAEASARDDRGGA